jgi:hypothetical protein
MARGCWSIYRWMKQVRRCWQSCREKSGVALLGPARFTIRFPLLMIESERYRQYA